MLRTIIAIFFIAMSAIFFLQNRLPFFLGLLAGTFLSMIKLIMLDSAIDKSLDMASSDAKNYIFARYLLRYLLTALFLFLVITNKNFSLCGFIIGLLSLQISAYVVGFSEKE